MAVGVLTLVLALFFSPAIFTSRQFLLRDAARMHGPVKRFVATELHQGRLPTWNPYAGLGAPMVAGAIDAVQHPFNLLLVALPFDAAFKAWILLSYLMAAAGGYAWARQLGLRLEASLTTGIAFALGGYLVSVSENLTYLTTLAAAPWLFAAAHLWLERGGPGRLALLGLASFLCAAGGDPQTWGFAVAVLPFYAVLLVDDGRPARVRLARAALALAAAVVAAAPVILPVAAWIPDSSRGDAPVPEENARWSMAWLRLLELAVPHVFRIRDGALVSPVHTVYGEATTPAPWVLSVYVGASVAALAALAAGGSRQARWLVAWAALTTWTALGWNAGFGQLASHVPVLSGFRYWEKMAAWSSLLLAAAAAFGMERLVSDAGRARRFAAAVGALGAAALAASAVLAAFPDGAVTLLQRGAARVASEELVANLRAGLLGAGASLATLALAAVAVARGRLGRGGPVLVLLVVLFDLAAANVRGYALASPELVRPSSRLGEHLRAQPGLQRVVTPFGTGLADRWLELRHFERAQRWYSLTLEPDFSMDFRVANFEPYVGMVPARISRFRRRIPNARQLPNLGMWSVGWVVVPEAPGRAAQANLSPPFEPAAVEPAIPAFLLPVPHRPRAYLAAEIASVDRRAAMEFALDPASVSSDRSVVEAPIPEGYRPPRGQARIVIDLPGRVSVSTTSDGPALLVLNDAYATGWRATVDGRPAEILPANYLARGVWVPAGSHRVEFTYRTPGLREGWAVFAAGALALLGWAAVARRRASNPPT